MVFQNLFRIALFLKSEFGYPTPWGQQSLLLPKEVGFAEVPVG